MARDEERIGERRKFSVVQQCPRCSELSFSFQNGSLRCSNCGYEEKVPSVS